MTIDSLRLMGKSKHLLCPVCKKTVFVKAGNKKSWHFAHYTIEDCPLRNESPNILKARQLLYKWLRSKFLEKVSIEKYVKNEFIPRPIDCYVGSEKNNDFLYWILESNIRSRWELKRALEKITTNNHWVFISSMLKLDDNTFNLVNLSTIERDFLYQSIYDERLYGIGKSLHYLDINENVIITLRGLYLTHAPQQYRFEKKLINKIDEMLISPKNGEFVHPGEHEKLIEHDRIIKEKELKLKQIQNKHSDCSNSICKKVYNKTFENKSAKQQNSILTKLVPCEICGVKTKDWSSLDTATGKCLCKKCLEKKFESSQKG